MTPPIRLAVIIHGYYPRIRRGPNGWWVPCRLACKKWGSTCTFSPGACPEQKQFEVIDGVPGVPHAGPRPQSNRPR